MVLSLGSLFSGSRGLGALTPPPFSYQYDRHAYIGLSFATHNFCYCRIYGFETYWFLKTDKLDKLTSVAGLVSQVADQQHNPCIFLFKLIQKMWIVNKKNVGV
jgi:hypothetical protein